MQPTQQNILYDSANGQIGNCFSAVIASLLEENMLDVPHFCLHENWREKTNEWLADKNLFYIDMLLRGDLRDELVKFFGYHEISGGSPRGDFDHSIVGFKGEPFFDPHPSGDMLLGKPNDWRYGFIIPRELYLLSHSSIPPVKGFFTGYISRCLQREPSQMFPVCPVCKFEYRERGQCGCPHDDGI